MISFKDYMEEAVGNNAGMLNIKRVLDSLGFGKTKMPTQTRINIYVADRDAAYKKVLKEIPGSYKDDSVKALNWSSAGAIGFDETSPYYGINLVMKPDASKDLNTDENESLQAYHIAAALKNPNTDFGMADLLKASSRVMSKYTIEDLMEKAPESWVESSQICARTIAGSQHAGDYTIHQRSKSTFITNLSKAAKNCISNAGSSIGLDKWNPSDVWMVHSSVESHDWNQYTSIAVLNDVITELFDQQKLVGVSLKKVKGTASIAMYNHPDSRLSIEFEGFEMGKRGFDQSMDMYMYFNGGRSIQLRSFNAAGKIQGEIKGANSAMGKIGNTGVMNALKSVSKYKITDTKKIIKRFETDFANVTDELFSMGKQLDPRSMKKYTREEYRSVILLKDNTLSYVVSKYQVAEIGMAMLKMKKAQKTAFLQSMIDFASSSLPISSTFIKVS